MLVKWVSCRVTDRARFDLGQQGWGRLSGFPGFLGQCGGWAGGSSAHVLGFWADAGSYRSFMDSLHDSLAAAQTGTYSSLDVRLFTRRLDIGPGFTAGELIRLAHCEVPAPRVPHFVRVQGGVWNPGMTAAGGMLGGTFGQRGDGEFLVLSGWRSAEDHERYRSAVFPGLRSAAGADASRIGGSLITVEPAWTV